MRLPLPKNKEYRHSVALARLGRLEDLQREYDKSPALFRDIVDGAELSSYIKELYEIITDTRDYC